MASKATSKRGKIATRSFISKVGADEDQVNGGQ